MKSKNIVKYFSISVSALLVNTANIKSFAQGGQDKTIVEVIQLANLLENQYEEINFALRFQVFGSREINKDSISNLVETQDKLVAQWEKFDKDFCQQNTSNCIDDNNNLAQRINDNLQILERIKPLFEKQQDTILSKEQYRSYKKPYQDYVKQLTAYDEKKAAGDPSVTGEDPPKNPIQPNNTVQAIQDFIKEELNKEKEKLQQANDNGNLAKIENQIKAIEKESGVFYLQTQEEIKRLSTEKSRDIEDDLLKINERFLTLNGGVVRPTSNTTIFYVIFGWLALLTIGLLIYLYFKFFRKKRNSEDASTANQEKLIYKDNLNVDEIANKFLTLYEKSVEDNKQSQKIFLEELLKTQSYNIKEYEQVSIYNSNILENIAQLLANINQQYKKQKQADIDTSIVQEKASKITSIKRPSILSTLKNSYKLENLLAKYNRNAKVLIVDITKVDATFESIEERRSGIKTPILFTETDGGSYWIVNEPSLKDDYYFLVPKAGLIINDRIYQNVEYIFNCKGYQKRTSNRFNLLLPAVVKSRPNNEWELVEPGEIMFEEKNIIENNK